MRRRNVIVLLVAFVVIAAVGTAAILDPNARVQGWVLGEPFYQGRSATSWQRDLRLTDENGPAAALATLTAGGGDSVPVCAWLIDHATEADVRRRALDAIKGMKKENAVKAAPQLVKALGDSDALVRGVAIRVVALHTPDAPQAVEKLIELFPDREAIRAVASYRDRGGKAVPALIPLLKHESADVRRQSARTLGKIGVAAKAAIPDLIRTMETDPEAGVREQSAEAFGDIGPTAVEAVPHLVKALKDPNKMVRRDAVRSLGQIGPGANAALADVKVLTNDPDKDVRTAANDAARKIDPSGK